jgi:hypothetical protein
LWAHLVAIEVLGERAVAIQHVRHRASVERLDGLDWLERLSFQARLQCGTAGQSGLAGLAALEFGRQGGGKHAA